MPKPFIELKNIGKIYVSEGNVAVGIRGVNLAFSRGEFVAITGASGSGKSTLLNVISGMDTYEEGELYIEGEPTSHYMQKDWEEYRKKYISFIFQEYNIIESFTVLQNVELALMNIRDPRQRREKAMELIRRVGLENFVRHKGSKLSGGQKQRTVIARALAKDSPVILADEPTGNLDSQTSAEIIELLREVSRDKLVIVVTHNFEQVEACATRHIRVFDGAVEADQVITPPSPVPEWRPQDNDPDTHASGSGKKQHLDTICNAAMLGRVRFTATPKLSVFLCILMTLVALIMTAVTSLSADASMLFDKNYMFTHMDGRVVIVRTDGGIMTEEELQKLAQDVGASDSIRYDYMLDQEVGYMMENEEEGFYDYYEFNFSYPADSVKLDAGRYPEAEDEMILRVPLSLMQVFGSGDDFQPTVLEKMFGMADYTVTGVSYYVDNTITPTMFFTEKGYKTATALAFFQEYIWQFNASVDFQYGHKGTMYNLSGDAFVVDFHMEPGTYAVPSLTAERIEKELGKEYGPFDAGKAQCQVTLSGSFTNYKYDYWYDGGYYYTAPAVEEIAPSYGSKETVTATLDKYRMAFALSPATEAHLQKGGYGDSTLIMAPDVLVNFLMEQYFTKSYTQATLLFDNDREAQEKVAALRALGYTAVPSTETVKEDVLDKLMRVLTYGMEALGWVLSVVFISLFLGLCSSRAMNATRGDIAIMRSMGIPTPVVKASIYFQTLISLIPAFLVTAATCVAVFLIPKTNGLFNFLHTGDYILLSIVLIAVAVQLSGRYVRKMFHESVKKTLKGGNKS